MLNYTGNAAKANKAKRNKARLVSRLASLATGAVALVSTAALAGSMVLLAQGIAGDDSGLGFMGDPAASYMLTVTIDGESHVADFNLTLRDCVTLWADYPAQVTLDCHR